MMKKYNPIESKKPALNISTLILRYDKKFDELNDTIRKGFDNICTRFELEPIVTDDEKRISALEHNRH